MDFRIKKVLQALAHMLQTKFSIRLSILSIVLILLLGISGLIISINYFSLNSILITSAKNSLFYSNGKVAEQIKNFLQPLNSNTLTAYRMFHEGIIKPHRSNFLQFLYSLIVDNEKLVAAYWGDTQGNLYWLNRNKDGFFAEIILRRGEKVVQATKISLNSQGKILSRGKLLNSDLDPRLRPWYQQAKKKKNLTWVIYNFLEIGSQKPQFGVTSAFPIYNAQGKLQGVFGIDMLLDTIAGYVKNINISPNSFIFVVNLKNGDLITAATTNQHLLTFDDSPNISDLKLPWLKESLTIYNRQQQSPFIYASANKKYIAAYASITSVKSDDPWFVAIATPITDIIAPLLKSVLINAIFSILALLVGIMLASIFSSSLSKPIKMLAQDAHLICQLQLEKINYLFSRIKEIAAMADSFIKMKNALYSFQRYMPITLVKKLIVSNKIATVGGEEKNLTLLFTDIKNFTQLAENFAPEYLMQYLSEYFQHITKVIIETQGTVDKYVGDGVVAFWGAPLDDPEHILHACQAALRIQPVLHQLNLKWQQEHQPQVTTRFGISSGKAVVGNVGSEDRLSYTALGDTVNLASRLEGLNKIYGTTIIVSEAVYEIVKNILKLRLLDKVAVKGKTQGGYIYELLGELNTPQDLAWEQYNQEFHQAFSHYEQGAWQQALALFYALEQQYPDDQVIKIFITRCANFLTTPPAIWQGIWIMDEK